MTGRRVELDGTPLSLADLVAVARGGARVEVTDWRALDAGRAWLDEHVEDWRSGRVRDAIYGVTTGFGASKNTALRPEEVEAAQVNLLRSHAVGITLAPDAYLEDDIVRAAALLRAHTFLRGRSGVRRDVVQALVGLLNADVQPRVPSRGSVGASGDLCPLAHFALVLIGEGEATVPEGDGRSVVDGAAALRRAGLEPLTLSYKEGLALINGTTISTACLALAVEEAHHVARTADVACALSFEALGAHGRALDAQVHAVRGQAGQEDSAASLRSLLEGSRRVSATDDKQDIYSFRCAPQVHGASRDALSYVRMVLGKELDAVTDNPLFFVMEGDAAPWDAGAFSENPARHGRTIETVPAYSAGNFHGQPVAVAADVLVIAVAELADIAERRLAALLDPAFSRGLPAHLSGAPGVSSGLMLLQYTSASLVSEIRTLAHPASVDSIPTGSGSEDHVSMSTWAARKARSAVRLAARVVALELAAAAQANEWRAVRADPAVGARAPAGEEGRAARRRFEELALEDVAAELGQGSAVAYRAVRDVTPRVVEDRSLAVDVEELAQRVLQGGFLEGLGTRVRPLRRARLDA